MKNREFEIAFQVSEQISDKLCMQFGVVKVPEMQIQLGEESVIPEEPKPIEFSTLLKIVEINEIYDSEKTDYLKIAMKLNQIELE